jgi:DNA-binding transcriptional regulator YbjK
MSNDNVNDGKGDLQPKQPEKDFDPLNLLKKQELNKQAELIDLAVNDDIVEETGDLLTEAERETLRMTAEQVDAARTSWAAVIKDPQKSLQALDDQQKRIEELIKAKDMEGLREMQRKVDEQLKMIVVAVSDVKKARAWDSVLIAAS